MVGFLQGTSKVSSIVNKKKNEAKSSDRSETCLKFWLITKPIQDSSLAGSILVHKKALWRRSRSIDIWHRGILNISANTSLLLWWLSRLVLVVRVLFEERLFDLLWHLFVFLADLPGFKIPCSSEYLRFEELAFVWTLDYSELTNFIVRNARSGFFDHAMTFLAVKYVRIGRTRNFNRLCRKGRRAHSGSLKMSLRAHDPNWFRSIRSQDHTTTRHKVSWSTKVITIGTHPISAVHHRFKNVTPKTNISSDAKYLCVNQNSHEALSNRALGFLIKEAIKIAI